MTKSLVGKYILDLNGNPLWIEEEQEASIQKCSNEVCIERFQGNRHNFVIKPTRAGFCSYCWTEIGVN